MKTRNTTIDFLRGLAVILMILIHVTVYFNGIPLVKSIWNYAQIAVPLFVFCSSYLYFAQSKDSPFSLSYILKRVKRLIIPYYYYLVGLFIFLIFIEKETITSKIFIKKVFLLGNYDLDWLVVLFIYFIFLMPLIRFLGQKPLWLWIFSLVSIISSIIIYFYKVPIHFRFVMWLPWSLILVTTYLFIKAKNKTLFYIIIITLPLCVFFLFRELIQFQDKSLLIIDNKYPPNLYYLCYGLFLTYILFLAHKVSFIEKTPIQPIFDFMSRYSYSIFFIHFLYLFLIRSLFDYKKLQWWGLFIILTVISAVTQWIWNKRRDLFGYVTASQR